MKVNNNSRQADMRGIQNALGASLRFIHEEALVAQGDSLSLLREMPSNSVSLILTDPPYHSTKKHNIYGDRSFEEDLHFLEWMGQFAKEWRRVLRPNGSLYCFCSSEMAARLEVLFSGDFNILSSIVWTKPNEPGFDGWKGKMKKEALRQWYPHSERIIFAEPAVEGNLHRSPFAQYLRETRKKSGLSGHKLTEVIGAYGQVNHGGSVSNWETGRNIPSRDQYTKIVEAILATGRVESMPAYEDAIRVFRVSKSVEFTDIWTFPSVRPYKGKHPAEKPASMLEHIIEASSFPGDIVLDCFAGSGSTALATVKLGRRAVALEIEPTWVSDITARISTALNADIPQPAASPIKRREVPQTPVFEKAGK
jgi:adenine-specific DNA-methyltransferase